MTTKRPTHRQTGAAHRGNPARHAKASAHRTTNAPSYRHKQKRPAAHCAPVQSVDAKTLQRGQGRASVPTNDEILMTRRRFLYGAIGVGVLAVAAGGIGVAATQLSKDDGEELVVLDVPENAVAVSTDYTQIDEVNSAMQLSTSAQLPYGSLIWATSDDVAACLIPTETSNPLTQIGILFLGSGSCPTVLSKAVGQDEGFDIYDVRACSNGAVWTEADILDGTWRVYSATLNGETLGSPTLLEENNSDWEMPTLAAVGSYAFWQVLPQAKGAMKSKKSLLKKAAFGSSETHEVYASTGRMCTPPYALADSVVITPRTNTSSVRYQLTRIDADTDSIMDTMVMPSSMKPLEAGYGNTGFMFSFDSIYNYGDGISNLGTYVPQTAVEAMPVAVVSEEEADQSSSSEETPKTVWGNAGYNDVAWFRFARTPSAAPCWCGNWLMVKSTSAVCGVDMSSGEYFALDVPSGCDSYGDYLASTGMNSRVVTFSNIDYKPINAEAQKHCLVRVWTPTA